MAYCVANVFPVEVRPLPMTGYLGSESSQSFGGQRAAFSLTDFWNDGMSAPISLLLHHFSSSELRI